MSLRFVIDAFNLIKRTSISQSNNQINPVRESSNGVKALIDFIINDRPQGSSRNKVTLVFDGHPALDFRAAKFPNLDIIFSREFSADEIIKRILINASGNKNMVVVSDDRDIVDTAKIHSIKIISTKDFFDKPKKKSRSRPSGHDADEKIISYSERVRINKELSQIWLKGFKRDEKQR